MSRSSTRRKISLAEYVRRRNGIPLGGGGSLRAMLYRSFGAASFTGFWQYWNPIFGYGLSRFVYAPLRQIIPDGIATVVTFVICGALHDFATMLVRQGPAFLFIPWFFLLGMGVVFSRAAQMDLSRHPWLVRAGVNFTYLAACFVPSHALSRWLGLS
ncbi:MAG: acyltransferase [Chloroflexi bacterium]|nr:acyltransferase [Chloroflexota bacterium]